MGLASWIASGLTAFALARIVPYGRSRRWATELVASLAVAIVLGGVATALDFGGWNELDWLAALLTFFGALAAEGAMRSLALMID